MSKGLFLSSYLHVGFCQEGVLYVIPVGVLGHNSVLSSQFWVSSWSFCVFPDGIKITAETDHLMRKVGCPFPRASSKEWGLDGLRMETAKNKQINKQPNRERATAQLLELAIFKSIGSYAQSVAGTSHYSLCTWQHPVTYLFCVTISLTPQSTSVSC